MNKCNRPCNSNECPGHGNINNECGSGARYVCTSGAAAGGCAANATSWEMTSACDSCCDRWHPQSCNECKRQCTEDECNRFNCPAVAPWVCASGKAQGGCGKNQQSWSMGIRANNGQCDDCCDSSACMRR